MSLKRGDTIIEVCFAFSVYSLVAILTIALMNSGTNTAQSSLELAMARNEIDAQAEAIRFIHNSYLSERELSTDRQEYRNIWLALTGGDGGIGINKGLAIQPDEVKELSISSCKDALDTVIGNDESRQNSFILNTRVIDPASKDLSTAIIANTHPENLDKFTEASLYPRIIYSGRQPDQDTDNVLMESAGSYFTDVSRIEGLWSFAVAAQNQATSLYEFPEFYDFHIRTCWYAPGRKYPSTIGTIIRLYNPELIEAAR